jgi:hypothetical protein
MYVVLMHRRRHALSLQTMALGNGQYRFCRHSQCRNPHNESNTIGDIGIAIVFGEQCLHEELSNDGRTKTHHHTNAGILVIEFACCIIVPSEEAATQQ